MAAAGAATTTEAATFLPVPTTSSSISSPEPPTLSHLTQIHTQLLHHGSQNDIASATKLTHRLFDFNTILVPSSSPFRNPIIFCVMYSSKF
ncbi:hypothetical protein LINPERPRIM_LOCUS22470 [Linum perenne]